MNDTIQVAVDGVVTSTNQITNGDANSMNWWMILAIVEFVFIVFLLLKRNVQTTERSKLKRKVMSEGDIDFDNIMNSSFNAEKLYKELIIKCHPDRFPDSEKSAIANDISARIGKCKNDIKQLEKLKQEAIERLNIKF